MTAVKFCAIDSSEYMVGTWGMVSALQAPGVPSIAFAFIESQTSLRMGQGMSRSVCVYYFILVLNGVSILIASLIKCWGFFENNQLF